MTLYPRKLIARELERANEHLEQAVRIARECGVDRFVADSLDLGYHDGPTLKWTARSGWEVFEDSEWKHSRCTIGWEEDRTSEWLSSPDYCER